MAQPVPGVNTVFSKMLAYLTVAGGGADGVAMGEVQGFTFDNANELEELRSPTGHFPTAVAIKAKKVTGTLKTATLNARGIQQMIGGTAAVATSISTVSQGLNDDTPKWDLHGYTGPGNIAGATVANAIDVKIKGCVCTSFKFDGNLDTYIMNDINFNAYGDGTNVIIIKSNGDTTGT